MPDKKKDGKKNKLTGAFETYALTGGKRDPKSGVTTPDEKSVCEAKNWVDFNKK